MNIDVNNAAPRLVITGCITTDTMPHVISVSQTVSYFGNDDVETFSGATVTLNGNPLFPMGGGQYSTGPGFFGEPGQTYTLEVELDYDGNGAPERYSAQAAVPLMQTLDSASLRPMLSSATGDPIWSVFVHFQDPPGPNAYGSHLYINEMKYTDKIQYYFLNAFGETAADGHYIHFPVFFIGRELNRGEADKINIYAGDTVTVELNSMTEVYYDFLRTARLEINGGNPLFAGPPANVPGNISGGALGVFGAYTASRQSIVLKEENGFPPRPDEP
jgi:hypothetical protein